MVEKTKVYGGNYGPRYRYQKWQAVPPPWSNPNPYVLEDISVQPGADFSRFAYTYANSRLGKNTIGYNAMVDQAYSRFKSKLGDPAMWAVNYAERKQAVLMISNRIMRTVRVLGRLKLNDYRRIHKMLVNSREVKGWHNTWLEYHFGWKPLVQDVYRSIEILSANPPSVYLTGAARYGDFDRQVPDTSDQWSSTYEWSIKIRGRVTCPNPNLHLASQLGLVNPASIAWELIPFSFVVDWFATTANFLSQWTDFAGLDTSKVSYTLRYRETRDEWIYYQPSGPLYGGPKVHVFYQERIPGMPYVPLTIRPFTGFSVTRGLTACSLLLQQLDLIRRNPR